MTNRVILLLGIFIIFYTLFACAPKEAPSEKPLLTQITAQKEPEATGKEQWEIKWEKTVTEAKREERLILFTGTGPVERKAISNEFKNKYGISLEIMVGNSSEMAERVLRENRAGILSLDLAISGTSPNLLVVKRAVPLDFIEPELILPEVKSPELWFEGKLNFWDQDKKILLFLAHKSGEIWINTNIVAKGELSSWKDLLEPKWKEKIITRDPTVLGGAYTLLGVIAEGPLGLDYLRKFAEQRPRIIRDQRLIAEWVSRGRYAIGLGAASDIMLEFQNAGLPLAQIGLPEGRYLGDGGASIMIFQGALHPNARKVFVNWLLSREGATVWSRAAGRQSARIDVPTDHLSPDFIRDPGVKYFSIRREEWISGESQRSERMKAIFGPLLQ